MPVSKERRLSLLGEIIVLIDEVLKVVPEKNQMPPAVRDSCGYFVSGDIIKRTRIRSKVTGEIQTQEHHNLVTGNDAEGRPVDFKKPTKLLGQLASMAEDLEISIPESCGFRTEIAKGATLFHECVWRLSMQGFRAKLVLYIADEEKRKTEATRNTSAKGDRKPTTTEVIRNQRIRFSCPCRCKEPPEHWSTIWVEYQRVHPEDKTASPDTLQKSHQRNCEKCLKDQK